MRLMLPTLGENAKLRRTLKPQAANLPMQMASWIEGLGGRRKVPVWKHYKVRMDPDNSEKVAELQCKICGPEDLVAFSGNTSNLRSHLAHVHKDVFCKMLGDEKCLNAPASSSDTPKAGTLDAILLPVSAERRDVLHKKFALWIARNKRPLYIGESDPELRDIFAYIFQGGYTPPSYHLVTQNILALSVEGKNKVRGELMALLEKDIMPCLGGDIWSEGGIAIFGIVVYWLDSDMEYHEKLLAAIPFSDVRHTGPEIMLATKLAAADMGIGRFVEEGDKVVEDTVCENVAFTPLYPIALQTWSVAGRTLMVTNVVATCLRFASSPSWSAAG
ncbi:hypothetical protein CYMTET_4011 [Cymbomonas tetramitiformis]|uniref:BED-type domain-containing protein n=1 Tax=Cymbomonas tetramitiformis TaxID=36881 RepID=A0AAE0H1Z7_9CHLO|nr:hypothetical protein CYMTET_4011 [Cymbomonas tetramitiformis]